MIPVKTCDTQQRVPWHETMLGKLQGFMQTVALVIAVGSFALLAMWSDARLGGQLQSMDEQAELIYVPPARFLKLVALNYEHALADVLWFRTMSYFGNHYRGDRVYPWLAYMCDVVTDLDPRAAYVYTFGGVILPWEADSVDSGIALLAKGTRNIPDSWRLWYMLGFSYYFFKNDLGAAGRALERATRLPDAPAFVSRMAAMIVAAHQGPSSAIAFLSELEHQEINPAIRSTLTQRIREIELAKNIEAIEDAAKTFEARIQRKPRDVGELLSAGVLAQIPPDPFGGHYVIDPQTGEVTSSVGGKAQRMGHSKVREAFLKRHED